MSYGKIPESSRMEILCKVYWLFVPLNITIMKFRIAKKIIFSLHWRVKLEKMDRYKPYCDEKGHWVMPSFHTHPVKYKAWRVYIKHKSRNKRRVYSL